MNKNWQAEAIKRKVKWQLQGLRGLATIHVLYLLSSLINIHQNKAWYYDTKGSNFNILSAGS